jgi:aspartate aminotransferase
VQGIERTLIRRIFDAAPPGAINLGLGEPDLPTPVEISLAGVAGIAEGRTHYTSTAGDPELRRAVAGRYPRIAGGPEGVLITAGSQEALYLGCLTLANPGSQILYPDPGYPAYATVARLVGAEPVAYPLRSGRSFRCVAEDVERRLTDRTELVVLCAPANPTGACHATQELKRLTDELARRGIAWLSDEVYAALTYDGPSASPADFAPGGGLVAGGLSKESRMTGWRLGWLVGPADTIARAAVVHQHIVTCAPALAQRSALAAFGERGRAARGRWLERLRKRRALMAHELGRIPGLGVTLPEGAFYFFVDVSRYGNAADICRRLLERRKVVTIPGAAFGKVAEGYLRLSFSAGREDIRRGVGAIREELTG